MVSLWRRLIEFLDFEECRVAVVHSYRTNYYTNIAQSITQDITQGVVFRAISKAGRVWGGMSPKVLCDVSG
jgi:hypothetical protein